jgi:hypothetical protein
MAYYETINLVSGDTGPDLDFTIKDSTSAALNTSLSPDDPGTWAVVDLSDETGTDGTAVTTKVFVKFRPLGGGTTNTIECERISPFHEGKCTMSWGAGTLNVPAGIYEAEISVDKGGKTITVFDKLKFKIRDDF